jgi:hypothetical protein
VKGWLGSAELASDSVVGFCCHVYSLSDLAILEISQPGETPSGSEAQPYCTEEGNFAF